MNTNLIKTAYKLGHQKGLEKRSSLNLQNAMKLIRSLSKSDHAATDIINNVVRVMRMSAATGRLTEPTFVNLAHAGRIARKFDNYRRAAHITLGGTRPISVMEPATVDLALPKPNASGAARDLLEEIGYLKPKSRIPIEDAIDTFAPNLRLH